MQATFASAEPRETSSDLPQWLVPGVLLLITSTVAVIGAVFSPRLRGQGDHLG